MQLRFPVQKQSRKTLCCLLLKLDIIMTEYRFPITLFQELSIIEHNSQAYSFLLENRRSFTASISFDCLSWSVINTISRPFQLSAFLMSYSLLRYKDVITLDLNLLLSGSTQTIIQSKTENPIIVKPLCSSIPSCLIDKLKFVFPFYHSYHKLAYAIQNASKSLIGNSMISHNSATHLFRYFRTCRSYYETNSFLSAQKFLGHKDVKATRFYVPEKLMQIYSNHLKKEL